MGNACCRDGTIAANLPYAKELKWRNKKLLGVAAPAPSTSPGELSAFLNANGEIDLIPTTTTDVSPSMDASSPSLAAGGFSLSDRPTTATTSPSSVSYRQQQHQQQPRDGRTSGATRHLDGGNGSTSLNPLWRVARPVDTSIAAAISSSRDAFAASPVQGHPRTTPPSTPPPAAMSLFPSILTMSDTSTSSSSSQAPPHRAQHHHQHQRHQLHSIRQSDSVTWGRASSSIIVVPTTLSMTMESGVLDEIPTNPLKDGAV